MRAWLTPVPDPAFETKCADICAVYHAAGTAALAGVRTVSLDEMTGIQALERRAPGLFRHLQHLRGHDIIDRQIDLRQRISI